MEDGTHRRPGPTAETAQIGMQDCCLGVLSSSGAAGAACFSYCRMLELVLLLPPPPLLILGGGRERGRWSRVFGEEGARSLGTKGKIERAWAARNGSSSSSTSGSSSHNAPRASSSRVGAKRFNLQRNKWFGIMNKLVMHREIHLHCKNRKNRKKKNRKIKNKKIGKHSIGSPTLVTYANTRSKSL